MPYFAVPRYLEFVDTLPTVESGKVIKYKLRERGITAATWDREKAGYQNLPALPDGRMPVGLLLYRF